MSENTSTKEFTNFTALFYFRRCSKICFSSIQKGPGGIF